MVAIQYPHLFPKLIEQWLTADKGAPGLERAWRDPVAVFMNDFGLRLDDRELRARNHENRMRHPRTGPEWVCRTAVTTSGGAKNVHGNRNKYRGNVTTSPLGTQKNLDSEGVDGNLEMLGREEKRRKEKEERRKEEEE